MIAFENLLKSILEKFGDDFSIRYSNVNGVEKLTINDEEIKLRDEFDDSNIKKFVSEYKETLDMLDDCMFMEIMEALPEDFDKARMDALLSQTSFTKEESDEILEFMDVFGEIAREHLQKKIEELSNIRYRF